jgi:hypothetical protein
MGREIYDRKTLTNVINTFERAINKNGIPNELVTDRKPSFFHFS